MTEIRKNQIKRNKNWDILGKNMLNQYFRC
jgi:hypothetical protein